MINFFRQLGGAFGVNLLSVSLDRDTFHYSDRLTSMQSAGNSATRELLSTMERPGAGRSIAGPAIRGRAGFPWTRIYARHIPWHFATAS